MSICEVRNLCKEYPGFKLKDVSFTLEPGTITGFIGRNGAGKTTTLKSMLGHVHPSRGEVYYFGLPCAGNENLIKQRISYSTGKVIPRKSLRSSSRSPGAFTPTGTTRRAPHTLSSSSSTRRRRPASCPRA